MHNIQKPTHSQLSFYVRQHITHLSHGISVCLSVCLSVGMLHGGIASKRLNIPDKCSSFQFILSRIDVRESKAKYRRAASLFFQLNVLD